MDSPVVLIRVSGPKSLVPQVLEEVECDMSWTWGEFLSRKCNIQVNPGDDIVVRNTGTGKSGWQASLGDVIVDFINKFRYIRKLYSIRLAWKTNSSAAAGANQLVPEEPHATNSSSGTFSKTLKRGQRGDGRDGKSRVVFSAKKMKTSAFKRPVEVDFGLVSGGQESIISTVSRNSAHEKQSYKSVYRRPPATTSPCILNLPKDGCMPGDEHADFRDDEDDDARSVFTTAAVEDYNLRREGISNHRIKPGVVARLSERHDNSELLRIRTELMALVESPNWLKVTLRAPRACHFLQDIFEVYPPTRHPGE